MRKLVQSILFAMLFSAAGIAHSDVLYSFQFTMQSRYQGEETLPDFEVTLRYKNYVTTRGFAPVAPVYSSTQSSLGYQVAYAGLWYPDSFAFDDATNNAYMDDDGFAYDERSFLFLTRPLAELDAPGIYAGFVVGTAAGRAPNFQGTGRLTITEIDEAAEVLEPSQLALLSVGMAGIACLRRRRSGSRADLG